MNEETGYNNTSALGFSVHSDIVAPYIFKYGSAEQKDLLPSMASGERITCIGKLQFLGLNHLKSTLPNTNCPILDDFHFYS